MAFLKVARRLLSMLSITSECQFSLQWDAD